MPATFVLRQKKFVNDPMIRWYMHIGCWIKFGLLCCAVACRKLENILEMKNSAYREISILISLNLAKGAIGEEK